MQVFKQYKISKGARATLILSTRQSAATFCVHMVDFFKSDTQLCELHFLEIVF